MKSVTRFCKMLPFMLLKGAKLPSALQILILLSGVLLFSNNVNGQCANASDGTPQKSIRPQWGDSWTQVNGNYTGNISNGGNGAIVACASAGTSFKADVTLRTKYCNTNFPITAALFASASSYFFGNNTPFKFPNQYATAPDMVWYNFDIRSFAGTFQYQIGDPNSVHSWALYYTDQSTAGLNPSGLSGQGSFVPTAYGYSTNSWVTITVPSFAEPTNYYLVVWKTDGDAAWNNSADVPAFQARYGCGGGTCFIEQTGTEEISCNNQNDTYTVCATFQGSAGRWLVQDNAINDATSIEVKLYDQANNLLQTITSPPTTPLFFELQTTAITSSLPFGGAIKAVICATYPQGTAYNILLDAQATYSGAGNGYVDCITDEGFSALTAPVCCSFEVTCPSESNRNLGTFNCTTINNIPPAPASLSDLTASPYNLVIGNNQCGTIRFTSSDNGSPVVCSEGDQIITRTITIWDNLDGDNEIDPNEESVVCTFTFTFEADDEAPELTGTLPTGQTGIEGCLEDIPAGPTEADIQALYSDECSTVTVVKTAVPGEENTDCSWTVIYNYVISDDCGNKATEVNITYSGGDNTAPQLTGTLPTGQTGMNVCFASIPTGPTVAEIKALYSDACGNVNVIKSGTPTGTNCSWSVTYRYSIADDCENAATAVEITYSGGDTEAPIITCPTDKTINCGANDQPSATGYATATDNCDNNVTITFSDAISSCENDKYVISRTWKAVDDCGKESTCVRKITVNTKLVSDCFTVQLIENEYNAGSNTTTFTYRACATNCPNSLSHISFLFDRSISVVSPPNGSLYVGLHNTYRVVTPPSNKTGGIKFETIGTGIQRNECDEFTFTVQGDRRGLDVTVEFKAGKKATKVIVDGDKCLCAQSLIVNRTTTIDPVQSTRIQESPSGIIMKAFPNPYMDEVTFRFTSPETGKANLELFDLLGRNRGIIFQGNVQQGIQQDVKYRVPGSAKEIFIYRLRIGNKFVTGKLIPGSK